MSCTAAASLVYEMDWGDMWRTIKSRAEEGMCMSRAEQREALGRSALILFPLDHLSLAGSCASVIRYA